MKDFLNRNSQVDLPVGGGPSGFIGQWMAAVMFQLYTDVPPSDLPVKPDSFRQTGGGSYWCYYRDGASALAAI